MSEEADKLKNLRLLKELEERDRLLEVYKKQISDQKLIEAQYLKEIESLRTPSLNETKLQKKLSQLQSETAEKKEELNAKSLERQARISKLRSKVQALARQLNVKEEFVDDGLHESTKQEHDKVYKAEVQIKQQELKEVQLLQNSLKNSVMKKEQEQQQLNKRVRLKKKELKEMYNLLNNVEEEQVFLKNNLDRNRRRSMSQAGNSLFDEVNNPRLESLQELSNAKQKCADVKIDVASKQSQELTLLMQSAEMERMLETPLVDPQSHANLIVGYKDRIRIMIDLCASYQAIGDEIEKLRINGFPFDTSKFIENFNKDKEGIMKNLKEIGQHEGLIEVAMYTECKEINLDLMRLNYSIQQLRNTNVEVVAKIAAATQDLQNLNTDEGIVSNIRSNLNCEKTVIANADGRSLSETNDCKADRKKVQFMESTDNSQQKDPLLYKGGRVLVHKTVHIPFKK